MEVDPNFASNRRIYTCQGTTDNGNSVQVVAWTVDAAYTTATRASDPLVGNIDGTSGRHGGCQLRVDSAGHLRIGTGDAAWGTNPQNRSQLAGKTLRVDRASGAGVPGNPFFGGGGDPRIFTFGHRNVQALAVRPGSGEIWSVEHGPTRDDEINRLVAGGNYGWDPVPTPYNESVPMTDFAKFPNVIGARWSSGFPTVAPSGATFLTGNWGPWQGALAVSMLKDRKLLVLAFDAAGRLIGQAVPPELNNTFGRLRAAEIGPGGLLFVTTDNGVNDKVLAISPSNPGFGIGVESSGPNVLDTAIRGVDGQVWVRTWTGAAWTPWTSLGGATLSDPDLASWGGGRADVFIRGTNGAVWHRARQGGSWGAWESLGGVVTSGPTAVARAPNRIDVFARGSDGALWSIAWNGSSWGAWRSLGGQITFDPDVASWASNRLDVFARGTDGAVWHRAWNGVGWQPWRTIGGGMTSGVTAVSWGVNRIDVFGRGLDAGLWGITWDARGWHSWYPLVGFLTSAPEVTSRASNRLDVMARGTDGGIYQREWNGGYFTPWHRVP